MNHKVSKEQLMAYLYGELEGEEKEMIRRFLEENPDAKEEYAALNKLSNQLKNIPEVNPPQQPIMIVKQDANENSKSYNLPVFWKKMGSIAAIFMLGILVAKALGLQLEVDKNSITIAFNNVSESMVENINTAETEINRNHKGLQSIESLISLLQNENRGLKEQMILLEENMEQLSLKADNNKLLISNANNISSENLNALFKSITDQNLLMVNNIIESSNKTQQQYMNKMFADYAGYLEDQRLQDLKQIDVSLKTLQAEAALKESQTKEIIARLAQTVNDKSN